MFQLGTPAWQIAVRAAVVYLTLLVGLRVLGKREIGQISLADLVLILLIANAVQNAMTGPDTSLEGGLLAAAVLLVVNLALTFGGVTVPWLGRALEGRRVALIVNGKVMAARLRRVGVSTDELLTALHENQVSGPEHVYEAYLEPDGQISVLPMSAKEHLRYAPARRKRRRIRQLRKH